MGEDGGVAIPPTNAGAKLDKAAAAKAQTELDAAWEKRRAKESGRLTRQEARNYLETHATDEQAGISPQIIEEETE